VMQRNELRDGEMRQVSVGETDVLLVRRGGRYAAFHAHCTHYGAPLADGVLSGDRIVCPWHHACFNASSGDQLEPPGLDALDAYDVRIDGDDVVVRVPEEAGGHRIVEMSRRDPADDRTFVILGGGAAGEYALEGLREKGFSGRVVLITKEAETPCDRPNCSKDYLQGKAPEEWMFLRGAAFYDDLDIERLHNRTVVKLDAAAKRLTFENCDEMDFDGIVICTGGVPRTLDVDGAELPGVHVLRSYRDAEELLAAGREASHAVVVGAGFIGMEAAWSLKELGVDTVTVVAPEDVPFAAAFGERVGKMVQSIHEEHGVRFRLGRIVQAFEGDDRVERVVIDDGEALEADLVIVGVGVRPATDFIDGLELAGDGAVVVDEQMRAADGVYAAGDIAQFPYWLTGRATRIEHWRLACQHGRIAGYNLAGEETAYRSVPFFWTAHFGTNIRYVGHADAWDVILFDGRPEDRSFIAFYVQGGEVVAASGCGRDREMAAIEELLRRRKVPSIDVLEGGDVDYVGLLD
ncbi:MAG: FAD-dependent oxidoreductase, partial [Rhodothermales bacterium]